PLAAQPHTQIVAGLSDLSRLSSKTDSDPEGEVAGISRRCTVEAQEVAGAQCDKNGQPHFGSNERLIRAHAPRLSPCPHDRGAKLKPRGTWRDICEADTHPSTSHATLGKQADRSEVINA